MWCPNLQCQKPIVSNTGKNRAKCQNCHKEACFSCNEAWHPGRSCNKFKKQSLGKLYRQNDIRKCPTCKANVEREKGEGCMNMVCFRCKTNFCWSCMIPLDEHDKKWYLKCPKLPYSMCTNILLTLLVIIFLPLLLLFVPLVHGLMLGVKDWSPLVLEWLEMKGVPQCMSGPLAYVVCVHFVIPTCLVIGLIVSAFLLVFGSIPIWFLCWTYLLRLLSLQCGLCCRS